MDDIVNEIDNLSKIYKLYRFKNELNYYLSQDVNTYSDKINKLNQIITNLETSNKKTVHDVCDQINKLVYKKPWNKLPNFHKNVKINEYIVEHYKDNKDLEKLLSDAVNDKLLNSNKYVVYDQLLCKIIEIPVLKEKDGKFILEFHKKKTKS